MWLPLSGVLAAQGVEKGDRVLVYMPMIPEAAFAMLACARIGAVHSVVFGGFAAKELATRIEDAKPKVIVSRLAALKASGSSNTSPFWMKPLTFQHPNRKNASSTSGPRKPLPDPWPGHLTGQAQRHPQRRWPAGRGGH
ncbi:MAG: AMP-binding protein [Desulfobacterales bacterium]